MAYLAIRGSRRSLHCWCRHFLAADPGRESEIYELAVAPLSDEKATCTRCLFPELLRALVCPSKRLAVVQVANATFAHGHLPTHPLCDELEVLAEMLTGDGNTRASVDGAVASCGALDMIGSFEAHEVLGVALACPHPGIRLIAASLLAPDGNEQALDVLVQATWAPLTTCQAQSCLDELGRDDLIPEQAHEPTLKVLGEFARWRDDFTFSGCGPLVSVELAAERNMSWPPNGKTETARLVRLHLRGDDGALRQEIAGSVADRGPYDLRGLDLGHFSVEDCLAYLCYKDLTEAGLIVEDQSGEGYNRLLGQWRKGGLEKAGVIAVADLSPRLRYGRRLVGIAVAQRQGRKGHVILDGDRSTWKPRSETGDIEPLALLGVHVGRQHLGLAGSSAVS